MSVVGKVSKRFVEELMDLREHVQLWIDLSSPAEAAAQLRHLASGWREHNTLLLDSMHQIQSNIETEDQLLDQTLIAMLMSGLHGLDHTISIAERIDAEYLTEPLYDPTID